jgi:hypothetical protein
MAFALANFIRSSSQANSNAPRIWMYESNDTIATIKAADYFLSVYQHLDAGDIILCRSDLDGNASFYELQVLAASSTTVTTQLKTNQELTASGAVNPGVQSIELNHASVVIAATIASTDAHQGLFVVKDTSASGTAAHTLTLTSGTFDGTNTVATLNAPDECLVVWFDSAGNGTIVENVGTVALS